MYKNVYRPPVLALICSAGVVLFGGCFLIYQASMNRNTEKLHSKLSQQYEIKEENKKLANIINAMALKIEVQSKEIEALKKQLDEYKQSQIQHNKSSLNIQSIMDTQSNEDVIDIEERKEFELEINENNERSREGLDVASMIMKRYKTDSFDDIADIADMEEGLIFITDDESSYDEYEKLEVDRRKSLQILSKSVDEETIAMQKELWTMQELSNKSLHKMTMQELSGDGITNESETNKTKIGVDPLNIPQDLVNPNSNLLRRGSNDKWDSKQLRTQKQEMQAHMIHLVRSHTKTNVHSPTINDTVK